MKTLTKAVQDWEHRLSLIRDGLDDSAWGEVERNGLAGLAYGLSDCINDTKEVLRSFGSWRRFDDPPDGEMEKWTREVVVLTNYGDVFVLSYYHGKDGGCWQRPHRFNPGEQVEWWTDTPEIREEIVY